MFGISFRTQYEVENGLHGLKPAPYLIAGAVIGGVVAGSVMLGRASHFTRWSIPVFFVAAIVGYGVQWLMWYSQRQMHYSSAATFGMLTVMASALIGLGLGSLSTLLLN